MSVSVIAGGVSLSVRSAARSHAGRVRVVNEDRVLDRADDWFWAVADGMGGHAGGAEAADRVIGGLSAVERSSSGFALLNDIECELDVAHNALRLQGGGSTIVSLMIREDHLACLWAGDSRAYRLRDGQLVALTRDHSVVQQMVDAGTLDAAEARAHPRSHVVTRAVGAGDRLVLERRFDTVQSGDRFILCSDGLTTCVGNDMIATLLGRSNPDDAATALVGAALDAGAPDNVSLIVIELA